MGAEEQKFEALSQAVGKASWNQLWAAVDNIINMHQPSEIYIINRQDCPTHGPDSPGGYGESAGWPVPDNLEIKCPSCSVRTELACENWNCANWNCERDWPCITIELVCGALGINPGDVA